MTIAQVARAAAVDASYLGELERGRRNVSVTTLLELARAVGVSPAELMAAGSSAASGTSLDADAAGGGAGG
jgi:transcriptional regulator with XRE-family HTH domain